MKNIKSYKERKRTKLEEKYTTINKLKKIFTLIFFILLGFSCKNKSQNNKHLIMSSFTKIDAKLNDAAEKLNSKVDTSIGGYNVNGVSVPNDKIETRKIFWADGQLQKGIIIAPNFEHGKY
jgi:hypothetical protein